jgi:hypothetical protein
MIATTPASQVDRSLETRGRPEGLGDEDGDTELP